jgi:hypothetical protein
MMLPDFLSFGATDCHSFLGDERDHWMQHPQQCLEHVHQRVTGAFRSIRVVRV